MNIEFVGNFLENAVDMCWEFMLAILDEFTQDATEEIMTEMNIIVKNNKKILKYQLEYMSPSLIERFTSDDRVAEGKGIQATYLMAENKFLCLLQDPRVLEQAKLKDEPPEKWLVLANETKLDPDEWVHLEFILDGIHKNKEGKIVEKIDFDYSWEDNPKFKNLVESWTKNGQ